MKSKCGSCDWIGEPYIDLSGTPDLNERLDPGSEVPSGECACGALCYKLKPVKRKALEFRSYGAGSLSFTAIHKRSRHHLGYVRKAFANRWAFFSVPGTAFAAGSLREIAEFLEEKNANR